MITGKNILCVSSIDWDFIWQGHQEIMSTLAGQGNRVLFLENTGVRAPRFRDVPRLRSRFRNWRRGTKGFRQEFHNLFIYSPILLPFPYSRVARWINRVFLLRSLRRWMRAANFHSPIAWTFLPTPLARDVIRDVDAELTIYYCIDDLGSSSPAARQITSSEQEFFREADLVFVTSEKLRQRAAQFSAHVHFFPFGVNYEAFERARLSLDGVPPDVSALPRPVIGYVGGLHQWVDQSLVCAVADAMPEASVALIGPIQTDVSALRQRRNVHLLGAKPHAELPQYIKAFDVGIVPYRLSDYTSHVYPTKLNEYLAMAVPVVATDLLEIRRFNDRHGAIVATAGDAKAFVAAVHNATRDGTADSVWRLDVARSNSWRSRIAEMSALIEQALTERAEAQPPWDVTLRRVYRTARRRMLQTAVAALAVYLLLFATPALWVVAAPLRMAAPSQPADAIVVFAGGVGESGNAGEGYQERVREAVELYRQGFARTLVFSSGYAYSFREAEVMRALAVAQGVAPSDIILETSAKNTRENVAFVRDILAERRYRQVLLISSPYDMRRATLTWRRLAPDIEAIPTPATQSLFYAHRFGASPAQIRGIAHEYAAIVYYWVNGWI